MIKNPKKLFKILLKLALAFGIICIIALVVLFKLGGKNDQLREGAEEFLSSVSGTRALINDLNFLGFYPSIKIDIDNTVFQENGDPTNIVMTMDRLHFSMPFSHYLLNKKTVEFFEISKFEGMKGFPFAKKLVLDEAILQSAPDDRAGGLLKFNGTYGEQEFRGNMPVMAIPYKEDRTLYKLESEVPFEFITDNFSFFTNLKEGKKGTHLLDVRLVEGGADKLSGDFFLSNKDHVVLEGTAKAGESVFTVKADFYKNEAEDDSEEDTSSINISIQSDNARTQDLDLLKDSLKRALDFFYAKKDGAYAINQVVMLDLDFKTLSCDAGSAELQAKYTKDAQNEGQWSASETLTQTHPCTTYLNDYLNKNDILQESQIE